jgi:hypothetical protein
MKIAIATIPDYLWKCTAAKQSAKTRNHHNWSAVDHSDRDDGLSRAHRKQG